MSALHDKLQSQGFDILAFPCNQVLPHSFATTTGSGFWFIIKFPEL